MKKMHFSPVDYTIALLALILIVLIVALIQM